MSARRRVLVILFVAFSIECNLSCDLNISSHEYDACDFNSLFLVNPRTGFTLAQQNCGLEVHKSAFEDQPYVFYPDAREDFKYTIIMVDEDNPMSEDGNIFLQWMIVNVDGLALKYGVGHNYGELFAAYLPPNPSQDSCVHHYSIYIFEQTLNQLEFPDLPPRRSEFDFNQFLDDVFPHGAFCGPIASIEFQTRY